MSALNNASVGITQHFNQINVNSEDMAKSLKDIAINGGISEQDIDEQLDILDKFSQEKQKEF